MRDKKTDANAVAAQLGDELPFLGKKAREPILNAEHVGRLESLQVIDIHS